MLRIHICGLPAPADGRWHIAGYLEHKCGCCEMAARFVRHRKQAEYRCAKCMGKAQVSLPLLDGVPKEAPDAG